MQPPCLVHTLLFRFLIIAIWNFEFFEFWKIQKIGILDIAVSLPIVFFWYFVNFLEFKFWRIEKNRQ